MLLSVPLRYSLSLNLLFLRLSLPQSSPLFLLFFLFLTSIFFNGFLDVFHMRNQMAFVQQLEAVGMWWFSSIFFFSFHVLLLINGFLDVFHMRNQMAFVQKLEVVGMWWFSSIFFFFSF